MRTRLAPLIAACLLASPAHAACRAESGPQAVALLELFTSEGCNSCPPADRWLSGLARSGIGADRVVPLAFHVDYWDYIGWKDRFADPACTRRQKDYAASGGTGFAYTPQLVLNGRDFRGGLSARRLSEATAAINATPARAAITLELEAAPQQFRLSGFALVPAAADRREAAVYLALYENHLASEVKAGENAGVRLEHDYVVREWLGPIVPDAQGRADLSRALSLKPGQKPRDSGVVAWVQDRRSGAVLQALQLPYCGS